MFYLLALIYLVMCFLVGIVGRKTRIGFWGVSLLSFLFTPVLVFVFLILFQPERNGAAKR